MENIEIIFENENFLIADKPAGVLVHPTAAEEKDTLVDWLLHKYPDIKNLPWPEINRAGIVHRLDKDTSGLIIVAKNPETLTRLQSLFKNREIKKTYQALVLGKTSDEGKIEAAIMRDPKKDSMKIQETAYSWTRGTVRPSVTFYKSIMRYCYKSNDLTLVEVYPQTGRMHQIRVHLKYAGFPVVGDQLYQTKLSKKISDDLNIHRQFLHAVKLEFDGQVFESELADDLKVILSKLE